MLKGKNINLRVLAKEDLPILVDWFNDPDFFGKFNPILQTSKLELEKSFENQGSSNYRCFLIEKKDARKIGYINHFDVIWNGIGNLVTIAYVLIPIERGKGYGTEAAKLMVDFLFLSRNIPCIQATTHINNVASQRVLEKVGFRKEGIIRKRFYVQGQWIDQVLYSILKEEWKEPKIIK
ncbi:MAG: GNAT family protein [Candidatus Bathyarchaeota archaeon]